MRTCAELLAQARQLGIERLDAQLLLLHALGTRPSAANARRSWLLAHADEVTTLDQAAAFEELVARRRQGEPLAYIVGYREFHGIDLSVDSRVLVPRPDTEALVEWGLDCLDRESSAMSVLDLGTGSGAIALALKHARPGINVCAVDRSIAALTVARANADALGLAIAFVESDWFEALTASFNLVISNPPYVAAGDVHLAALRHEPLEALVSGADGLDAIRDIVRQASRYLCPGGWLLLEHGYEQASQVRTLLQHGGYSEVTTRKDLAGRERCSGGRLDPERARHETKMK